MTDFEPAHITDGGEHPKKYKHVEISGAFNPLRPSQAWDIAARYSDLSAQWEAGVEVFHSSIKKSISDAWEGVAADKAKDEIARYATSARELTDPLTNLSGLVSDAAQAITDTNSRLPDPVEEKSWWHKDSWPWVGTHRDSVIEERQEEAQAAMKDYYVDRFVGLDSKIPVLPRPIDIADPASVPVPVPATGGGDTGGSRHDTGGVAEGGIDGDSEGGPGLTPAEEGEQPEDSATEEEKPGSQTGSEGETTAASTSPNSTQTQTTPGSTTQADSNRPSSTTSTVPSGANTTPGGTAAGTPGRTTGSGSSRPGTGSSGRGSGAGSPGPGRSVIGTPGTSTSTPAAAATSTSASAASRTSGMPGMGGMGGGRGGGSEQDSDHGIPDYLITMENTEELLGEFPKTLPGGVIGVDPPRE